MEILSSSNRRRVDPAERRDAVARSARRIGRVAAHAAAAALGLAAAGRAATAAAAWLTASPDLELREIRFTGRVHAGEEELLRLGGIERGANLTTLDLALAERRMAEHAWVRAVRLTRALPHALHVDVREWTAAALVDLDRLYLVSADGHLFRRLAPGDAVDLPVITGVARGDFVEDRAGAESVLREALEAIAAYGARRLASRESLSEVRADPDHGITLRLGADAFAVKLGHGPFEDKLARLEQLADALGRQGERAEVVHLDNRRRPDWVAVRLSGGAAKSARP